MRFGGEVVWRQPYDASHRRALPREYKINLLENNVEQKMRFGGELPGPGFLVKGF